MNLSLVRDVTSLSRHGAVRFPTTKLVSSCSRLISSSSLSSTVSPLLVDPLGFSTSIKAKSICVDVDNNMHEGSSIGHYTKIVAVLCRDMNLNIDCCSF